MLEPQTDLAIFKLYLWRCVECKHMATELNHVIPKSRGDEYDVWWNKVPMCRTCHDLYHKGGVNESKIKMLQDRSLKFLTQIGKEEYAKAIQEKSQVP